MVTNMPRIVLAIIVTWLLLAACASGSFLGLATSSYVDEQLAVTRTEVDASVHGLDSQLRGELSSLQEEVVERARKSAVDVQRVDDLTVELEALLSTIRENEQATQELQQLATVVAQRLDDLPTETLRRLVDILQMSLIISGDAQEAG